MLIVRGSEHVYSMCVSMHLMQKSQDRWMALFLVQPLIGYNYGSVIFLLRVGIHGAVVAQPRCSQELRPHSGANGHTRYRQTRAAIGSHMGRVFFSLLRHGRFATRCNGTEKKKGITVVWPLYYIVFFIFYNFKKKCQLFFICFASSFSETFSAVDAV